MKLTRLCKSAESWDEEKCPAVYLAEEVTWMAGQGKRLDDQTNGELRHLAADEVGNLIPTETVLRAAGLFLAARGRPDIAAEIESFLVDWLVAPPMSRWIHDAKDPAWPALFSDYTKSAYRLEGQQIYSNDHEDAVLARFLAGEPLELDLSRTAPRTRAQVAAGRTKTRVRVVIEPPTDYTRLELVIYPELADAGEDIRIIAVPEGEWPTGLPRYDYWLFDERDVWRMHYHDNYRFHGAELIEDEAAIAQHLEWRDMALAQAVPLQDYLAARQNE